MTTSLEEFQASLTKKVEDNSALSKVVSAVTERQKSNEKYGSSAGKTGNLASNFVRGDPPATYRAGRTRPLHLYTSQSWLYRKDLGRAHASFNCPKAPLDPVKPTAVQLDLGLM